MPQNFLLKVRKRQIDMESGDPITDYSYVSTQTELLSALGVVWADAANADPPQDMPTSALAVNPGAGEWLVAVPDYYVGDLVASDGYGAWQDGGPIEYKVDVITVT